MPLHNFKCPDCGIFEAISEWNDVLREINPAPCPTCSVLSSRVFLPSAFHRAHSIHPSERVAYDYNPTTGQIGVPMRNTEPLNPTHKAMGFERRYASSMKEVEWVGEKLGRTSPLIRGDGNRD
jgi:hypothetical protein